MADGLATVKPRPGVEEWKNPQNGFTILRLHFSSDPEKRLPGWKAAIARDMHPRAFRREYEIDWASPEGEPVVPEFDEAIHVREIAVVAGLQLLRFWDFGFDSPVVLFGQLTLWDQLRIYGELCPFNTTLLQLVPAAEAVAKQMLGLDAYLGGIRASDFTGREDEDDLSETYRFESAPADMPTDKLGRARPDRRTFDAGDPEGNSRKSLGIESAVMGRFGLKLHTIRPGTEKSYAELRSRFLRSIVVPGAGRQPAIVISPNCRLLRQALGGAFCRSVLPPYKPKKVHPWKDLVDALRYGNDNLDALKHGVDRRWRDLAASDIQPTRA